MIILLKLNNKNFMVTNKISKLIIRYLIYVGVPYLLARKFEKFFWKKINDETQTQIKEELTNSTKGPTRKSLNRRGGEFDPITLVIIKRVMVHFGIKVAIVTGFTLSIYAESADRAVKHTVRYSNVILAAPSRELTRIVKKLKKINPEHSNDIKEILIDKEPTSEEKIKFLKLKIDYALKNLKGKKRKKFIFLLIALLTFYYGNNLAVFTWLWETIL